MRKKGTLRHRECVETELHSAQEAVYFDQLTNPSSPKYNIGGYIIIKGRLESEKLCQAMQQVFELQDCLTVAFDFSNDIPKQVFYKYSESPKVQLIDLRSKDNPKAAALQWVQARFNTPFNINKDRLMELAILRVADEESWWFNKYHHLVIDGLGFVTQCQLLADIYSKLMKKEASDCSLDMPKYSDEVKQSTEYIGSAKYKKDAIYWDEKFNVFPESLLLPSINREKKIGLNEGVSIDIPEGLRESIGTLEKVANVSLLQLVLAALTIYFSKTQLRETIIFGIPVHNRRNRRLRDMIGAMSGVLPCVVDFVKSDSLLELLMKIRKSQRSDYRHKQYPISHLNRALKSLSKGRTQIYDISVTYDLFDFELSFDGLTSQVYQVESEINDMPLQFRLCDYGKSKPLELKVNCNLAYFEKGEAKLLAERLLYILGQFDGGLKKNLSSVDIIPGKERNLLLDGWTDTTSEFPRDTCIQELFEAQVAITPDAVALVFGEKQLTYSDLNKQSNQLAHYLSAQGVKKDILVGICLERSLEMVVAILGVLKAGGAYVPLDSGYPIERLDWMLRDSDVLVLVTQLDVLAMLPDRKKDLTLCMNDPGFQSDLLMQSQSNPIVNDLASSHLAYVIYTSGTTGKPKGVMIEHCNVVNFLSGLDCALDVVGNKQNVWLASTSISFDISILELIWNLVNGSKLIIQPGKPAQPKYPNNVVSPIDFSLFYFSSDEHQASDNKYRLLLEGAKFADQNDFKAVWVPERHFHRFGGLYPSPSIAAAAVSTITSKVEIRSGSIVLPLHDPVRVVEEWSMVDNLSSGRIGLAFASGWHPNDYVFAPESYKTRHKVLKDNIKIFNSLWGGGSCTRRNGLGSDVEVSTLPSPIQPKPPIWITASGSVETFEYAGSIGASVLTHLLGQTVEELKAKIALYHRSLSDHGFKPDEAVVTLMLHTFIADDPVFVEQTVREPFKSYLRDSIGLMKQIEDQSGIYLTKDQEVIVEMAYQRYFYTSGLFGTPESCMSRMAELYQCGVTEVACLVDFGIEENLTLKNLAHLDRLRKLVRKDFSQQELLAKRSGIASSIEKLIKKHNVSHMQITPSFMNELIASESGKDAVKGLVEILIGGEAWPQDLAKKLHEISPARIFNMYGPTETTIWSAVHPVDGNQANIGRPIINTQFQVLDEHMQLVPVAVAGELYIGGAGVGRGYLNNPELTDEKFVHGKFGNKSCGRFYRTGDLVRYMPDGTLEFLGRLDHQVKVRGFRIELGEIEAILNSHILIKDAIVLMREDQQGDKRLVAYVVSQPVSSESELIAKLRSYLSMQLPDYMLPSAFVILDTMPLTLNGKLDRNALPAPDTGMTQEEYVSPRTETECALCEIWQEVLGVESVGLNDNFFKLGGNSLLALKLVTMIQQKFQVEVNVSDLFLEPEVGIISERIEIETIIAKNVRLQERSKTVSEMEW